MRRPVAQGGAPKVKKTNRSRVDTRSPSATQAQPDTPQPSAAEFRNALLARAVLEASASPEPAFVWWLYRNPVSGLLAIRVLYADELARGPFPEPRGRA